MEVIRCLDRKFYQRKRKEFIKSVDFTIVMHTFKSVLNYVFESTANELLKISSKYLNFELKEYKDKGENIKTPSNR